MSANPEELLRRYEAGIAQMREMPTIVPPEYATVKPAPREWSAHQVLVHMADSEIVGAGRIRQTLAEAEPDLYFYDQDAWADNLDYHGSAAEEAIALAIVVRRATLNLLKRMPPEAWQRRGRHPRRGLMTIADLVTLYSDHVEIHVRQLEDIRAAVARL